MLFAFASRLTSTLLGSLLAADLAAPTGLPCGDNEQLTCVGCYEPTCSVPYYPDDECHYFDICKLGCGCKYGYVRHDQSFKCVSAVHCEFISSHKRYHENRN
ncbi:uncharacterized protein LOC132783998 [Drosophila nasuta]|uniref:Uncharacterized protein LOC117576297 n=1 Tax=Drosophila albomicans TaxID=7291 RepID=A0A6P8XU03_DROAB|nr:uncharacterized protein LOC117576297 [Drosophila albomicans]XP_060645330.1 uncharacterized protein LOC132783998 [Drosophila nasuta]